MKALWFLMIMVLIVLLTGTQPVAAEKDGWLPTSMGASSMAASTETIVYSEFDNGAGRIEFDYNRNTGDVSRFRCVNNTAYPVWGGAYSVDPVTGAETLLWQGTCQPGQTVTFTVNKFNLQWDLVDGGLIMGNYQLRARWPA